MLSEDSQWALLKSFFDSNGIISHQIESYNNFVTFGEDVNGELYIAGITSGTIYKIIDSSLSNSYFNSESFSLFPNPAKVSFTIKNALTNPATKIELFDISGKLIQTLNFLTAPENTIDTSGLVKGIYFVSVETTNGTNYTTRVIVE